jgi:hypothetical protein
MLHAKFEIPKSLKYNQNLCKPYARSLVRQPKLRTIFMTALLGATTDIKFSNQLIKHKAIQVERGGKQTKILDTDHYMCCDSNNSAQVTEYIQLCMAHYSTVCQLYNE